MIDLRELLRLRVERGAALLDSVEPTWWRRIENELLLVDCKRCVLGQVYGDYVKGLEQLFDGGATFHDADNHGFDIGVLPQPIASRDGWIALSDLWLEAIEARRQS